MRRREFIAGLCAAAMPLAVRAQPAGRLTRIGLLTFGGQLENPLFEALRQELRRLGYIEGQTCTIEFRTAGGKITQLQSLANELVRLPVDIIVTEGTPASVAAKQATPSIPIVMGVVADPVASGLVSNLARPGGNITGFTSFSIELGTKRVALLKEAVPALTRLGILWNPDSAGSGQPQVTAIETAARTLGISIVVEGAHNRAAIPGAFDRLAAHGVSAITTVAESVFFNEHKLIVELALAKRMPGIYPDPPFVNAGGLMFYGPNVPDNFRRAAGYVDRILKGTKPGDLPVEQPVTFELVVNLKTAKAIGHEIPAGLLLRADKLIE